MIGIGISTYNDFVNTNVLINSIKRCTKGDYSIVVVDDGTTDGRIVSALKKVCENHNVKFSRNNSNMGIPYTWNRLTELCSVSPEDIVVLFNNDILITDKKWLRCIEYFLDSNDMIGTAGFPLIFPDDKNRTDKENTWGTTPGHVGASVGCCFGFRKKVWQQVKNPDGSTGFWEDLISFHEETEFGFKLSELGYYNFQLPFPPMIHFGGRTFDKDSKQNGHLSERVVDWTKWDKQEYIETVKRSKVYPEEWKKDRIAWTDENGKDVVNRMAFSRYMFAKHWNVLGNYNAPQEPVHERVVTPMPKRRVKWLDMDLKEMEAEV